ncbi:uncharacterized protein LOC107465907 [Arachis duranensis]|uniref:Uncharacterized protein LOC107465907 n=1 Tax=Arachis duranensis TaxID=130453 RepID=A0A6P4BIC0_ARADU|nr:uncharacterized protein LOC107465907 [Arachis duranensis]
MTRSLPDSSLVTFDPKIERTISRIKRARHWLASEDGEVININSPVSSESKSEPPFEEETSSSTTDSVDSRAYNMAAPRRITIQEVGAPDFTLQPYQVHNPAVAIGSLNNSNNQPSSSSGLPSQPLPNPKGGINAITLRSGTTLQERYQEEPSPSEHTPAEDAVEVEDAKEEEDI